MRPPTPVGLASMTSTFQRWRSAYFVYMRARSAANSAASSPPAPGPDLHERRSCSSLGSLGRSRRLISSSSVGLPPVQGSRPRPGPAPASRGRCSGRGGGRRPSCFKHLAVLAEARHDLGASPRAPCAGARSRTGCGAPGSASARAMSCDRSSIWRSVSNSIMGQGLPTAPPRAGRSQPAAGGAPYGRATGGLALVLPLESLHTAGGVEDLLLAREEGMASGADLDPDVRPGRPGRDDLTTRARDGRIDVVRMNAHLHAHTSLEALTLPARPQ